MRHLRAPTKAGITERRSFRLSVIPDSRSAFHAFGHPETAPRGAVRTKPLFLRPAGGGLMVGGGSPRESENRMSGGGCVAMAAGGGMSPGRVGLAA